jgi:CHAT domain-containing protein
MRILRVLVLWAAPLAWASPEEPAAPEQESIAPGQVQVRAVPLQPGQRLHLRLDQSHLDAEVKVLAPDGSTLGLVDNAIGRGDPLTLTVLANASGLHRIEIRLTKPTSRFHDLNRPMDEALCEYGMGNALGNARRHTEALPHLQKALPLLQRAGNKHFAGLTLNWLGLCHLALRQYSIARRDFQEAIRTIDSTGNRRLATSLGGNLGRVLLEEGHPAEALVRLERARQLHHEIGDRAHESIMLMAIGRAERQLGRLEEARQHVLEGIRLVEQSRSTIVGATARASYLATQHARYEGLVNVLMDLQAKSPAAGWSAQALGASETARARSLLELLADARADVRDQIPPALREEERAFDQRLETQRKDQARLLRQSHTAAEADAMERSLENLRIEGEEIQARMRAASPSYASLTRPSPLTLEEIRAQVLDSSSVLLEYFLGEERSYVWAVSSDRLVSAQLPQRPVVEAAAARVYRVWSNPSAADDGRAAAEALARMVLGPVASGLSGKRILVAADVALAQIPFGALPEPGASRPLLEGHEIVAVPSASVLAVLRGATRARPAPEVEVAVLADPSFTPGGGTAQKPPEVASLSGDLARSLEDGGLRHLEPLPATRQEAAAIAAHAPPGRVFTALGFEASRATVLGEKVAHARVVHLASHALLDAKRPELSGVVLAMYDESGKPQDGFLSLADVYRMRLDAELVVLSACRTGLGKELRGEGLLGLTRGFMNAGAPRVVASLWKVSDRATAALMDRFYRALLEEKLAPAAALRKAQLELRKERRFSSPFAWAGFELQGEWRPMPDQ